MMEVDMGEDKITSEKMAHLAAEILRNPDAPELEKSLAGSVLSMRDPGREPHPDLVHIAAEIMSHSHDFSDHARSLAASLVSQAN